MATGLLKQFVQFALVGGLGTVTNLCIFFVIVDLAGIGPLTGATIAFAAAVTQNYILNELWTFNPEGANRVTRGRYGKFVFFSLLALGVNLGVLQLLISHYEFPLLVIPQAIGIAVATSLNYTTSRLVTFR